MPQNFLSCDRDQSLLLPPDLRDWLDEDHLAWFVIEAIEQLDLEPFYAAYRVDGHGRAAHDPQLMLTLLAYAYCVGERSSRGIERRCREDVAFRVICANQLPAHATIARFRVRHQEALAGCSARCWALCRGGAGAGRADRRRRFEAPSRGVRRGDPQLRGDRRRGAREAERIDAAEDERFGAARGAELPGPLAGRGGRRACLGAAKERLERERGAGAESIPRGRGERLELCRRRLVEDWRAEHWGNRAYDAHRARGVMKDGRRFGRPPDRYTPPAEPDGKINTTDPDARRMKSGRNFIPAYNAQAAVTEQQIIVAAEITTGGRRLRATRPGRHGGRARASSGRRRAAPRGRAGRRRLLVERPHRSAQSTRHDPARRPRHHTQPTTQDKARRALRLHAKSARHRARRRALLTKTAGLDPGRVDTSGRLFH
jgi:transposase